MTISKMTISKKRSTCKERLAGSGGRWARAFAAGRAVVLILTVVARFLGDYARPQTTCVCTGLRCRRLPSETLGVFFLDDVFVIGCIDFLKRAGLAPQLRHRFHRVHMLATFLRIPA